MKKTKAEQTATSLMIWIIIGLAVLAIALWIFSDNIKKADENQDDIFDNAKRCAENPFAEGCTTTGNDDDKDDDSSADNNNPGGSS